MVRYKTNTPITKKPMEFTSNTTTTSSPRLENNRRARTLTSVFLFLGEIKFTRAFKVSDTEQKMGEFIELILERSVVLLSMNASAVHNSSIGNITSWLVNDLGGNTQGTPAQWYCLIGYCGLETYPWIHEQKRPPEEACDITSVIKLPGNASSAVSSFV